MPLEAFAQSQSLSLGVELELQLIARNDLDLTPACPDMLELLRRKPFPGGVTPEITESMIEICSTVQTEFAPLQAQLLAIRDTLVAAADQLNVGICGGGTHPFQHWPDRRIFDKPRFREVSALYGYLTKQFTVFGQHVHVGCRSGDEALFLLHALSRFVPHFIALSASSPFVQGHDTQFCSARLNSVFSFPLSGRAPFLLRWDDFAEQYFDRMARTGIVTSMKDFYWDLRPKPEYGTIELRVCDCPLDVPHAAALAGYLQALCAYLLDGNECAPAEDDYLVYNYNRFQACRFGLDGITVHPKEYGQAVLRDEISALLPRLRPYADALAGGAALDAIERRLAEDVDAHALRRAYLTRNSLEDMVDYAMLRFRAPH